MIDSLDWRKQASTAKPLLKGYNFFMSKHVLAIYHQVKDSKYYIKSQVLPSMKKNMVYSCFIKLSSLGFVLAAKCGCPAGINGRCNHVCATLFYLDSMHKKKQSKSNIDDDVSCTSKPCQWNVPSKIKGTITPIASMKFKKHDYIKLKKEKKATTTAEVGVDTRSVDRPEWSKERLNEMLEKLKKIQEEAGQTIGWCHILHQDVPEKSSADKHELLSPITIQESPISLQGIKKRAERVKTKLFVDPVRAVEIEQETIEQSKSESWHFHRQPRITASKCYWSAVIKDTTSPTKAINDILYKKVVPTRQMREGLEMESNIMESGHTDLAVSKSGLVVGRYEDGFLAASPDGLICVPSVTDTKGLLEMKYIQTEKDERLEHALLRKRMCVSGASGIHMNRNHKYFYQIQQGMYLTECHWTDFVVAGSQTACLYIERVNYDRLWWENVKKKLKLFYETYILPELAYPRIKCGLPRMDLLRHH